MKYNLIEAVNREFYGDKLTDYEFDYLTAIDPTEHKGKLYSRWIIEIYLKLPPEDKVKLIAGDLIKNSDTLMTSSFSTYDIVEVLRTYDKYNKNKYFPKDKKQILQFKSFPQFINFIQVELAEVMKKIKMSIAYDEANIILDTPEYVFLTPKTYESSCFFGDGTNWCTARTESSNYWNQYAQKVKIYIYREKAGDKEGEFSDVNMSAIQLSLPKEGVRYLAECRDHNDKTLYAERIFKNLPQDNKVVAYLEQTWNSVPNTDQWDEGTGYLDPDVLYPHDVDKNKRRECILYRCYGLCRKKVIYL